MTLTCSFFLLFVYTCIAVDWLIDLLMFNTTFSHISTILLHYCITGDPIIKRGGFGIPLASWTPPHLCACLKPGPGISNVTCHGLVWSFLMFIELRWEPILSFCWYLWKCWPSLFKISFHYSNNAPCSYDENSFLKTWHSQNFIHQYKSDSKIPCRLAKLIQNLEMKHIWVEMDKKSVTII